MLALLSQSMSAKSRFLYLWSASPKLERYASSLDRRARPSSVRCSSRFMGFPIDTLAVLGADAPHVLGFLVVAIVAVAAPAASIDGDRAPAHIAATRIAAADALPIVTSFASNKKPVSVCHRCLAISGAAIFFDLSATITFHADEPHHCIVLPARLITAALTFADRAFSFHRQLPMAAVSGIGGPSWSQSYRDCTARPCCPFSLSSLVRSMRGRSLRVISAAKIHLDRSCLSPIAQHAGSQLARHQRDCTLVGIFGQSRYSASNFRAAKTYRSHSIPWSSL
jgi:hypothetical protein